MRRATGYTGRVRLLSTFKDDFKSSKGFTDSSDKALEVLLSSTRRKPMVIFSARALARPRSRRGLVPTPDAVIFAELPMKYVSQALIYANSTLQWLKSDTQRARTDVARRKPASSIGIGVDPLHPFISQRTRSKKLVYHSRIHYVIIATAALAQEESQQEFATARLFVNKCNVLIDNRSARIEKTVVNLAMSLTGGRRDHCANLKPKTEREREREKGLANKTACHGDEWGDLARRSQIACVPRRAPWDD
ncbi:hypothetical protein ALC53_09655 [Atta colombica]|uniref:Uncharacterized protein n=1 Tax=Atta colombica TaxID=520822 RepID=A0A151I1G1_9HYME|nr:hypothetical protein ALC53_09655 [Atta colombica]